MIDKEFFYQAVGYGFIRVVLDVLVVLIFSLFVFIPMAFFTDLGWRQIAIIGIFVSMSVLWVLIPCCYWVYQVIKLIKNKLAQELCKLINKEQGE